MESSDAYLWIHKELNQHSLQYTVDILDEQKYFDRIFDLMKEVHQSNNSQEFRNGFKLWISAIIDDIWSGEALEVWDIPPVGRQSEPAGFNDRKYKYDTAEVLATPRLRFNTEQKEKSSSPKRSRSPVNKLQEIQTETLSSRPTQASPRTRDSLGSEALSTPRTFASIVTSPKSVHRRHDNKIFKISEFTTPSSPTFSFSKTSRFGKQKNNSPGPGSYYDNLLKKSSSNSKLDKRKNRFSGKKKNYVSSEMLSPLRKFLSSKKY